jgi:2,3-bisphosphoglycerate-independent phosphoglycerate mutase
MEEERSIELVPSLAIEADTKIVLLVMDGLGGIRTDERGSELHAAKTPNLDRLAQEGSSGVHTLVSPGITPGSGAGHLALFGYDPRKFDLGRGALSAAGVGFELKPGDVAARVNFCTIDARGIVTDRRAGRISTEENGRLCKEILSQVALGEGIRMSFVPEREHRALLVLQGDDLSPDIGDTDPQQTGVPPLAPRALSTQAQKTAEVVKELLEQVRASLDGETANFILLRGFDSHRQLPSFTERYKAKGMGIAGYPMYIGISRLLGMAVADPQPDFESEVSALESAWGSHDFFYIHQKKTDSAGEDGDFDRKVAAIEEVDATVPRISGLSPDVICVTGDHATPSQLRSHSWHPVPFLLWGPSVGRDGVARFDEESAIDGGFGRQRAVHLMALMLGAANRLAKFGP